MGGVAVLHPQDLLNHNNHRSNIISPAIKTHSLPRNPTVNRSSHPRKRSPQKNTSPSKKESSHHKPTKPHTANSGSPVMGQVKILRRGEPLPASSPPPEQQKVQKTNNSRKKKMGSLGARVPQNDPVGKLSSSESSLDQKKQIQSLDWYAGAAIVTSPPPSSVPVPAFFKKKNLADDINSNNNEATSDLLRLLKLDL